MSAEGYGGDGGAGEKREMMTIGGLHDGRPANRLPPVGRFDEKVSDTTQEPRGMPEADASPLTCDRREDFLSEPLKRCASLKGPSAYRRVERGITGLLISLLRPSYREATDCCGNRWDNDGQKGVKEATLGKFPVTKQRPSSR